jgi:outer membrane immunogenic protein
MKGSSACARGVLTCSDDVNWLATVAGRVGYSFDQVMLYGKGGVAFMDRDLTVSGLGATSTASGSRTGWVAGAGVEWAFAPAWSVKWEYNHMDFGSQNIIGTSVDQTVDAVKAGVNYRFGPVGGR